MKENKRNKLKTTLQIIMYIFIILSFLRSFLAKASAESAPDWVEDYFKDEIYNDVLLTDYNTMLPYLDTAFSNCPYVSKITFTGTTDKAYVILFSSHERISPAICSFSWSGGSHFIVSSTGQSYSRGVICSDSLRSASNYYAYIFSYYRGSYSFCSASVNGTTVSTSNSYGSMYFVPSSSYNRLFYHGDTLQGNIYTKSLSYMSYGILPMGTLGDSFYGFTSNNLRDRLYDDRFTYFTSYNETGDKMLNIRWSDSAYPDNFTLTQSEMVLTINKNGTKSTVSFDSVNNPELFISGNASYIPYSFIQKVANIATISEDDILTLTKIELRQKAYAPSASADSGTWYSASTLCSLNLNSASVEIENYNPSVTEFDNDTIIDKLTTAQKDAMKYDVQFGIGTGLTFQQYHDTHKPDIYEDNAVYVYMSDGGTLSALLGLFNNWGGDTNGIIDFIDSIDNEIDIKNSIRDYLYDNSFVGTYSMIVFVFIDSWTDFTAGTFDSSQLTYYYFVTLTGRLREISSQLVDLYSDTNQIAFNSSVLYSYLKTVLDNIDSNSSSFFTKALYNDSVMVDWLYSINTNIISGFSNVLDALNRLHNFDDDDIIDRIDAVISALGNVTGGGGDDLSDTLEYLFVPSYDGFEDNISTAIDDIGILAMPFYTVKYFLDSAKEAEYKETLDVTFPSFEYSGTQYWDSYTASFNPSSIFPDDWFEFLQYCNLLFFSLAIVLLTYKHLFGDSTDVRSNTL